MDFPPGRTVLLIAAFMVAGAIGLLFHPAAPPSDEMVVWTFDPRHAATYQQSAGAQPSLVEQFAQQTHRRVRVEVMPSRVLDARLLSLILSQSTGETVPDLVEIEIGSVGKYLRDTPATGGLLPLDAFIAADPLAQALSPARLETWSHAGRVMGVPRDVHPVTITYRDDLFREAGIDLSASQSWEAFHTACLNYEAFFRARGTPRRAMQLSRWSASDLMILLHQQHIELVDDAGRPDLSDARIAPTIAFYARLVSGPQAISEQVSGSAMARDLGDGHTAALFTPDWRVDYLRWDPDLLGRVRMMPLPRFAPTDARTASWGGTMLAIPRHARDPAESWQLLRHLQLTPEALHARATHSDILPAVTSAWAAAANMPPNPVYGGQHIAQLYAELAQELPSQRVSPYSLLLAQSLASVLSSAQAHLARSGVDGLDEHCADELAAAQRRLDRLVGFAEGTP